MTTIKKFETRGDSGTHFEERVTHPEKKTLNRCCCCC